MLRDMGIFHDFPLQASPQLCLAMPRIAPTSMSARSRGAFHPFIMLVAGEIGEPVRTISVISCKINTLDCEIIPHGVGSGKYWTSNCSLSMALLKFGITACYVKDKQFHYCIYRNHPFWGVILHHPITRADPIVT